MSSRREALRVIGAAAAASLVAPRIWLPHGLEAAGNLSQFTSGLPGCVVTPQQTEGPYFVDHQMRRADLRIDQATGAITPGIPLALSVNVVQLDGNDCRPLTGAVVDVWQCDAHGQYSGVVDRARGFDTRGRNFLRGHQITDAEGRVEFTTIYPGWYPGRPVHIHFKLRTSASAARAGEFTSQWYFDDTLSDQVLASGPYAEKNGRRTLNDRDRIYRRGGGDLMLAITRTASGYAGRFDLGVRLA